MSNGNFKTVYKEKSLIVELDSLRELADMKLIDFVKLQGKPIEGFVSGRNKIKKHVVVIGGGMSAEREVSYMSSNGSRYCLSIVKLET
jgi:thioredoxin reductase